MAASVVIPGEARAATRIWTGAGVTNNWSEAANWSGPVPGPGDTALFDGTGVKDATIDIPAVQGVVINPGYTGIITQGAGNLLTVGSAGFSQAAATFAGESTAALTVTGAFTLSGGTFAHNGGTVAFSTSNVTIDVGGSLNLNNVSFLSGTKTIAAGNTLVVLGTLNLAGGTINTGTLAAQGDISVGLGFTGGGTATLLIDGSGPQTMIGFHSSVAGALPNVNIAKPLDTLTLAGTLRTARNWTYTSGGLAAAGSTVVFNGNLNVTGSHTLDNVELRSGTVVIAAGTTLTVPGILTLTSGSLSGTGTLAAQADITANIGFTGGGTATLRIDGSGAQALNGLHSSLAGSMPNVDIAKPSGTLTIAGIVRTGRNWTYTSGGLLVAGSTLVFTGAAGQTITGNHTLNAVEIRGGTVTIAAGTTLTAGGNLLLFSGSFGNTGTLAAQGDTDAASGFTGGTATLLINGSGAQALTQAVSATNSLPAVNIAKPLGTLTMTGTFRTLRNWTYTSGGLSAAGSSIQFAGTMAITGSHTLDAVTIAGTVSINAGTTLTVPGILTLTSGSLSGTGTLAAQADITANIGFTGGGTATLRIDGSGAQALNGLHSSLAGSMPNVDIAKPSGTLTIAGIVRTGRNWTYTSGGLLVAGSTLVFTGAAGQTITGNHTLNAVEIRGGTVTIAAGTTLTAGGNLLLFSGSFGNTGTLAAQGDTDAASGFTGGTATLLINGSGAQALTQAVSATNSLPAVNIAKPLGTLTMTGTFRTLRNWTYTSGGLSAAGSSIQFAGTMAITGSHTLDAVTIAGTVSINAGTTLTVPGILTLTSGSLSGTGTLAAQADITANIGFTGGGTATLRIDGSGAQALNGLHSSLAGSMPNVDIAKPSGTLTIAGIVRTGRNWTYTSGGLLVAGSTLVFTGAAGQTITGNHTLNAVEIRGGTVTIAAGTTLTAGGTLELFSGSLNTGTLAAQGDINARLGFTGGGTATLLIDGSGAQAVNGFHSSAAGSMPNVDIAKPSGTLTITGILRTARNWTYTSGGLLVAGSTLVFNGNLTISGDHTLNDVELRSGNVTVTLGDTLTVGGLLTLTNGNLEGGTVQAVGDIVLLDTFDGETGTILIAGTGAQTLTGSATAASDVANIVINKPSGTLFLVGTIRLLTSSWTWLDGIVDAGTSLVIFDTGTTIDAAGMTFADVQVTGGTATLVSDLNVGGDLFVFGGTLDGASNTITVAGDVTVDGSISPGTGMLVMNGTVGQSLGGSAAVIGLYDLTVDNGSGVTMTAPVSVVGTLTLNGPLNFNGTILSIANQIAGPPTNLSGDATSSLVVTGTGAGIVVPSSLTTLLNLSTDNPNGFALAAPLTVGGTLTLAGGIVDATAGTLTIGPSGSVVRTSGHVHGSLEQWVPLGTGVGVTFHVGDATRYAPASLLFGTVSTSGTITARTTPGEHPSIATSVIDPAQDVNRWWSLTNSGTVFDSLDATFTFDPADVDAGAQTAAFVVGKWDGAWVLPAVSGQTPTSITASGMTSLSEFAMGEAAGVPPSPSPTPTPSPSPGATGLPNTTSQPDPAAGSPHLLPILVGLMILLLLANIAARRPMLRD